MRRAAQLATSLNAAWTAVTIGPVAQEGMPGRANQLAKTFSLAERLGGDTARLEGSNYPAEILRLARRENVTQIVIGQSTRRLVGRS